MPGLPMLDFRPIFKALNENYNFFVVQDLGMLPCKELLACWPKIRSRAKVILINHDNKPKPKHHIFWQFDWDAIVNFLPAQKFMAKYYPKEKIHLIEFPCRTLLKLDKREVRKKLGLPNKEIVLTFGEYDYVAPFKALDELRKELGLYLVALVANELEKQQLEQKLKLLGFVKGYDEIRIESLSWKERAQYVTAASFVILDKGATKGEGAVISSTACEIIGWNTPIIARASKFFEPFPKGTIALYKNDKELKAKIRELLKESARKEQLKRAKAFALAHSPHRTATKLLHLLVNL